MKHSGFDAWIECDGERLAEYGMKEEMNEPGQKKSDTVISAFIPSSSGKAFSIVVHDSEKESDVQATVFLDGRWAQTFFYSASQFSENQNAHIRSIRISEDLKADLQFMPLILSDTVQNTYSESWNLGVIAIHLLRGRKTIRQKARTTFASPSPAHTFEECETKLIDHQVGLGQPFACSPPPLVSFASDYQGTTEFKFRYRSSRVLRVLGYDVLEEPSTESEGPFALARIQKRESKLDRSQSPDIKPSGLVADEGDTSAFYRGAVNRMQTLEKQHEILNKDLVAKEKELIAMQQLENTLIAGASVQGKGKGCMTQKDDEEAAFYASVQTHLQNLKGERDRLKEEVAHKDKALEALKALQTAVGQDFEERPAKRARLG